MSILDNMNGCIILCTQWRKYSWQKSKKNFFKVQSPCILC